MECRVNIRRPALAFIDAIAPAIELMGDDDRAVRGRKPRDQRFDRLAIRAMNVVVVQQHDGDRQDQEDGKYPAPP
jgi:hypothetical protein